MGDQPPTVKVRLTAVGWLAVAVWFSGPPLVALTVDAPFWVKASITLGGTFVLTMIAPIVIARRWVTTIPGPDDPAPPR